MAFAATTKAQTIFGNKRVHYGQFTQSSGDTGETRTGYWIAIGGL